MVYFKDHDTPDGAPPDYASALASSGAPTTSPPQPTDEKRPFSSWPPPSSAAGPSRTSLPSPRTESNPSGGGLLDLLNPEKWKRWREDEEIRRTVLSLLRDVIHNLSEPSSLEVLHSCYIACVSHNISYSTLSQEPIESHPPIYWAVLTLSPIVKALPGGSLSSSSPPGGWPLLNALSFFPLSDLTQQEATRACVLGDDNALFQYLWGSEGFAPTGLAENVGVGKLADAVSVEHVADGKAGHFRMRVRFVNWLKRMRMHKIVTARWIARGRAWQLTFAISGHHDPFPNGTWFCSVDLVRNTGSTPTALKAGICIGANSALVSNPSTEPSSASSRPHDDGTPLPTPPKGVHLSLVKNTLREEEHRGCHVKLSSTPGAASLEYEDSPYIERDGSVWVEADFVLE